MCPSSRIILRWIFRKWEGIWGTGWSWLRSTVMNFRVPKMRRISWAAAEPVSFSRRTLLHGVSKYAPIIKRNNCIYATLGTCHSVWMTVWYAGCTLHTRQSSTQDNKYQVLHKHSCFSWLWAHNRPKHVEKRNNHTKNKLCTKLTLFTRLYRGARTTKHKIHSMQAIIHRPHLLPLKQYFPQLSIALQNEKWRGKEWSLWAVLDNYTFPYLLLASCWCRYLNSVS